MNNKVLCLLSRSLISPASTHKTGQLVCEYCKISDLVQFLEVNFKTEQLKISLFPWFSRHFRCYSGFQDTKLAYSHLQDFFLHEKKENACCCILIGLRYLIMYVWCITISLEGCKQLWIMITCSKGNYVLQHGKEVSFLIIYIFVLN